MNRFALLSGAIKNAGDYLIVERCKALLLNRYPDTVITEYSRLFPLSVSLNEINQNDILIFAGGPGYLPDCWPSHMPLTTKLDEIQIPLFSLGMGWFGADDQADTLYSYKFTEQTIQLWRRIETDSGFLGCRDWYSVNALRNNGIESGVMTGCPAWYSLPDINRSELRVNPTRSLHKICISDPANLRDLPAALQVVDHIMRQFPGTEVSFVFHRGIPDEKGAPEEIKLYRLLLDALKMYGIQILDISKNSTGFSIYNDCDFHIGFRVHAHLYNLSRRNASVLIEEDGRGAGVNHALGLESIRAYTYTAALRENGQTGLKKKVNRTVTRELDDFLNYLWNTDFSCYQRAFEVMQETYCRMQEHINLIGQIIA